MTHLIKRRYFSGNTLDQAVMLAARYHQIDPREVNYRLVDKRHGFVRIRRSVVIEVDPDHPLRAAAARVPQEAPARERRQPAAREKGGARRREAAAERKSIRVEPAGGPPTRVRAAEGSASLVSLPERPRPLAEQFPPASGALALAAEKALALLFDLSGLRLRALVLQGEERLEIELSGEDSDRLLRDRGELLLAMQHLLPRMIRGFVGESTPLRIDCENFHVIREERLRDLAQRVASEVRRSGLPRELEPMAPDERRIVHATLLHDPAVTTESRGEGYYRRITIKPQPRPAATR